MGHPGERERNRQRGEEPVDVPGSEPRARHDLSPDQERPPLLLADLEVVAGRLVIKDDGRGASARLELAPASPGNREPIGAPRVGLLGVPSSPALKVDPEVSDWLAALLQRAVDGCGAG